MLLIVIRRNVPAKYPDVALSLYQEFCKAKRMSLGHMKYTGALRYILSFLPADIDVIEKVFRGDP